jgi:hypothetical protein
MRLKFLANFLKTANIDEVLQQGSLTDLAVMLQNTFTSKNIVLLAFFLAKQQLS